MKRKQKEIPVTDGFPATTAPKALKMMLRLIFQADRGYYLVLLFRALFGAMSGIVNLFLPKILIDGFTRGWDFSVFLTSILIFAGVKFVILQAANLLKRQSELHEEVLYRKVPMVFAQKVMRLPYPMLEDPKVLDLKERALFPITNYGSLGNLMGSSLNLLTGLLTLGGMAVLLYQFSPWFLLALLILCLVATLLSGRHARFMRVQMQEIIPTNRRYGYWANAVTEEKNQKDFRLFGLDEVMNRKINSYTKEITDWLHALYVRDGNNQTFQSLIIALMRLMAYGYSALRVLGSAWGAQIGLGDYTVVVMATENFFSTFQRAVMGVFETISTLHHLMPFSQFMMLKEADRQPGTRRPEPLESLAFENVSFRYPNGDRQILDNLSFEIKAGQKISIVGLNNAGKSTMVKLICRLFEPQSGRILWNGVDIRDYDYQAYLKELSCVFQDFFLFPFSIRSNIDPEGKGSEKSILAVLEETDMLEAISRLPGGISTHLNKSIWEDATDFSGGEKQKLAIARSLYRPAKLVILDEPTAALDPLAESEVYEHFHQLTRGRTAIFISHRMSSSTFCDKILLLQDGKLAAFDSHQRLMQGHNLYRELFEAQAQHFRTVRLEERAQIA
ncbi:MAG: ABC transporter ATP-binding protein [Christensenellales bacterium]|jgi:ATP-binding cassette subfamily B protein